MNILILLIGLLFLAIMLPVLLPIITILIVLALFMNVRKMFSNANYRRFENEADREERLAEERQKEADIRLKKDSSSPSGYQLPRSVQDDEFFDQEHHVMDVPYEEMDKNENGRDY